MVENKEKSVESLALDLIKILDDKIAPLEILLREAKKYNSGWAMTDKGVLMTSDDKIIVLKALKIKVDKA